MKILSVNPLYLIVDKVDEFIEEKMEVNIQFFILQMKTKEY